MKIKIAVLMAAFLGALALNASAQSTMSVPPVAIAINVPSRIPFSVTLTAPEAQALFPDLVTWISGEIAAGKITLPDGVTPATVRNLQIVPIMTGTTIRGGTINGTVWTGTGN